MVRQYVISKDYDKVTHEEFYYCHMTGYQYVPVFGSIGTKQHAKKYCDMMNRSVGQLKWTFTERSDREWARQNIRKANELQV